MLLLCQGEAAVGDVAVDRHGRGGAGFEGTRGRLQELPEAAGEVALEAAQGFAAGLAVGLLAREVGAVSGSRRPLVTARRCSAQLSWRLPPRSRRWRSVRPEEAGSVPSRRAERA